MGQDYMISPTTGTAHRGLVVVITDRGQDYLTSPDTGTAHQDLCLIGILNVIEIFDDDTFYSESSQRKSNVTLPKSISFDGKGDWRAFSTKFTTFAEGQRWSTKERKNNLCWSFEGKASEYYSRLVERDPQIDYFEILRKMERRFDIRDLPETAQVYFSYASQSSKEDLIEWADRVFTMATRATQTCLIIRLRNMQSSSSVRGGTDKAAGHYAVNLRPLTMEEAIDKIRWYQHTDRVMYGRGRSEVKTVRASTDYSEDSNN